MANNNQNIKFNVVVPVFNSEKWIKECVLSIFLQNMTNYRCCLINDASTDKTGEIIDELKAKQLDERFIIIHNKENVGALTNIINGFSILNSKDEPETVLITVDGDDRLSNPSSFDIVQRTYENNPNCLLTYGNFIQDIGVKSNNCHFPEEINKNRDYRKYKFCTSHLRTFKSKLFYNIKDQDLRDPRTGKYWGVACDVAMLIPCLELAGPDRFIFIEDILYIYNTQNSLSDDKVNNWEQGQVDRYIRTLPKYDLFVE